MTMCDWTWAIVSVGASCAVLWISFQCGKLGATKPTVMSRNLSMGLSIAYNGGSAAIGALAVLMWQGHLSWWWLLVVPALLVEIKLFGNR